MNTSAYSDRMSQQMVWLSGLLPYTQVVEVFARIGHQVIARTSVWERVQAHGEQMQAHVAGERERVAPERMMLPGPSQDPHQVKGISMDGGMMHLRGEGWKEFKREKKRRRERRDSPFRWFLKPGEKRRGTILDREVKFFAYEHVAKIGKNSYEPFICRRSAPDSDDYCPGCEEKIPRGYAIYLTIIDHKPSKDRRGRKYFLQKKLLVAKGDAIDVIQTKLEKMGSLRLTKWEIQRASSEGSPNVGTIWELIKTYEKEDLFALMEKKGIKKPSLKPLDYEKILPIRTPEEILDLIGKKNQAYGADDSEDIDDDDEDRPRPKKKKKRRL